MKLYLIRHGEGEHNVKKDGENNWTKLYPRLTKKGKEECRMIGEEIRDKKIDLILVSPLRRTLETGSIIFRGREMLVKEEIREYVKNKCDMMESKVEIEGEYNHVDFSLMGNEVNNEIEKEEDLMSRTKIFMDWLKKRKEKNIAIVGHGLFIENFLKMYEKKVGNKWLKNGEMREMDLSVDEQFRDRLSIEENNGEKDTGIKIE